jgi:hypothetical protein
MQVGIFAIPLKSWRIVYSPLWYRFKDDAAAQGVQIIFTTDATVRSDEPNLKAKCTRLVIKNNGMAFRPEDWARLKSIAEGNPGKLTSVIAQAYSCLHLLILNGR